MYFLDKNLPIIQFSELVQSALIKMDAETDFQVTYPEKAFGDFACNAALVLAKKTGKPPREIAETIQKHFPANELVDALEIAGPGFLNARLTKDFLQNDIEKIAAEGESYSKSAVGKEKTVVLDYSSPNIAKPLGVHHLLSTIIGQTLYNFYRELGFQTVSVNHIGDWGTQFGKIIAAYKKWGNRKQIEISPISEFLKLYVKFHDEAERDPLLEDEARAIFKQLEEGDAEVTALWKWITEMSYADIQKTYELIGGIHFDEVMGESFYNDKMAPILEEGERRGVFVKGEKGALVAEFPELPACVIRKSDGATLYITRDLATLQYRIGRWKPVKILYVVDVAQSLHFQQLFAIGEKFAWGRAEAVHVAFGRMSFKDKKMSTRKGNIVLLDEVLDEAVKRALAIIQEKNPDLPESEKKDVARKVGIGAVKYSILSQNRQTDMVFDWEKMLALDGNSAPYLLYTYVRYMSILKKAEGISARKGSVLFTAEEEVALARHLAKYREIINHAAFLYRPNVLSAYLHELTQICNSFYARCPVLKAETPEALATRLTLIKAVSIVLRGGLGLLGIETPERM